MSRNDNNMSRSVFLTPNEISTTTDRRFYHGLMPTTRSKDTLPIVVQSSLTKTSEQSNVRNHLSVKRNLRDKRRSTGIRPDDVSLASTSTEGSANDDDDEEEGEKTAFIHITEPIESFDSNRNIASSSSKSVFTVNRVQSSFDNSSIPRTEPYIRTSSTVYPNTTTKVFGPEDSIRRRVEKTFDEDSSMIKYRQLEERLHALESIVLDKDSMIYDLQRKLNNMTRDLTDAEQQIYLLHQDKLTLIKAFARFQDEQPSPEDINTNFATRN